MPELKNCKRCGKLFNYVGGNAICNTCRHEEEAEFQRIKKYLMENPGASIYQVASELDIRIDKIKKYLRDGRLEIIGDEGLPVLLCERCGKAIKTGKFCDECSRNMSAEFSKTASKIEEKLRLENGHSQAGSIGMRYLLKDDRRNRR